MKRRIEPKMYIRETQDFFEAYSNFPMLCVEAEKGEIFGGDGSKTWDSPEKREVAFFVDAAFTSKDQEKELVRWNGLMKETVEQSLACWEKEGWVVKTTQITKGGLKKFFSCPLCGGEREIVQNREKTSSWWECECPASRRR